MVPAVGMGTITHCPLYASMPHAFAKLEEVPWNLPNTVHLLSMALCCWTRSSWRFERS